MHRSRLMPPRRGMCFGCHATYRVCATFRDATLTCRFCGQKVLLPLPSVPGAEEPPSVEASENQVDPGPPMAPRGSSEQKKDPPGFGSIRLALAALAVFIAVFLLSVL